jgi:hypothetical protein
MKTRRFGFLAGLALLGVVTGVVMTAGCGGKGGAAVMGETLTTRVITDKVQGMPTGVVAVPASWHYDYTITWDYSHTQNPVWSSSKAENPANAEAVFGFPPLMFFDLRPGGEGIYRYGQDYRGMIYARPNPPADTLARFIRQQRGTQPGFTFVGIKDLPDLPAALKIPAGPNQHGLGIKVAYAMNGQPVEEEFYAVSYYVEIPYDGPQGRTWQIDWGLAALHSFRAPAGTLDKRRPVFAAIAKSYRPNPAWQQRLAAITKYLSDEFDRQLQAGYGAIAAAGRLSHQISANNDAMIAAIDRQLAASRSTSDSGGGERSSTDKFDDYIRGVETVNDPYYGTSQHSIDNSFHWTDGYGNYRNSNDASYDPNRSETGNWQPMKPIR